MQSLKDKILEGFFANIGADPFINWINEAFKATKTKYCKRLYITSKETAEYDLYANEYIVTKTEDKSLLFSNKFRKKQPIIINIPEIPEILNINPNNVFIFCTKNDRKNENIKFLFGQLAKTHGGNCNDTYINNVLLTVNKKTGAIIDKEIIPRILISEIPF